MSVEGHVGSTFALRLQAWFGYAKLSQGVNDSVCVCVFMVLCDKLVSVALYPAFLL